MNNLEVSMAQRLEKLQEMLADKSVDGFILPLTDEYQGEYSPAYARRVTWLTGFDGSAGQLLMLPTGAKKPALFVDGRYTVQAAQEVDAALYDIFNSGSTTLAECVLSRLPKGGLLTYDPWLHTKAQIDALKEKLQPRAIRVEPFGGNPIDALWENQPRRPKGKVWPHPLEHAGMSAATKCEQMALSLQEQGVQALLLTQSDAIAWLLNIRGEDVPYNPLVLCYALLLADGRVQLFIDAGKLDEVARAHLGEAVDILPDSVNAIATALQAFKSQKIGYDSSSSPVWFHDRLVAAGAEVVEMINPCSLAKARKNATEQEGAARAHILDGVAVTRFLHWFDTLPEGANVTELEAEAKLESFRADAESYCGQSFATIAGSGEHGAIVHYRAKEESNRSIATGDVLLCDSGGQYPFGTTDITRTMVRGAAQAEKAFKQQFTAVLKGHIALASAQFPAGTSGSQLDALARKPLWQLGLDYAHGTGHGVGSYLCVHEGPQRISKRGGDVPLEAGMIVSNEPGYYEEGSHGIRIESLVLVEPAEAEGFLQFNTLTLAPIDTRLVEAQSLTSSEQNWLNAYHARVQETLTPLLELEVAGWLAGRCAAV